MKRPPLWFLRRPAMWILRFRVSYRMWMMLGPAPWFKELTAFLLYTFAVALLTVAISKGCEHDAHAGSPPLRIQQAGTSRPIQFKLNFASGCTATNNAGAKRTDVNCGGAITSPMHLLGDDTHYGILSISALNAAFNIDVTSTIPKIQIGVADSPDSTDIVIGQLTGTGRTTINGGTLAINVGPSGGGDLSCSACGPGATQATYLGFYGNDPWLEFGKTSTMHLEMHGVWNGAFTFDGKGDSLGRLAGGTHAITCATSSSAAGCDLTIVPGASNGTDKAGGTVTINASAPTGSGAVGYVSICEDGTATGTCNLGPTGNAINRNSTGLKMTSTTSTADFVPIDLVGTSSVHMLTVTNGNAGFVARQGSNGRISTNATEGTVIEWATKKVVVDTIGTHVTGALDSGGGSAGKAVCWKADGKTLGFCSDTVGATGGCTCN